MRLIHLPTFWTIFLDILAWGIIQTMVGWLGMHLPKALIQPSRFLFQTFVWEKDGRIYQALFMVKSWKGNLPYGGSLFQSRFTMRTLGEVSVNHIDRWILETCRSELTHWLAILPAALFFFWNETWVGWVMVIYALIFNLPLIVVQRYNRPRLRKMLKVLDCQKQTAYHRFDKN